MVAPAVGIPKAFPKVPAGWQADNKPRPSSWSLAGHRRPQGCFPDTPAGCRLDEAPCPHDLLLSVGSTLAPGQSRCGMGSRGQRPTVP